MSDSTRLRDIVDECAAGAVELVVEADAGGEAEEALEDAFFDAGERAGAVAFQGEQVFAGPEDRFDPLPDRGEARPLARLVFAAGTNDHGRELVDRLGEVAAGVAFVGEQRFAACSLAAGEQFEPDLAFVAFGGGERQRSGGAVGGEDRVQSETPEVAGVGGAPAVAGGVRQLRAFDRLATSSALDRGR